MPEGSPLLWSVAQLVAAYRSGELSPVEVTSEALARIEEGDAELHAFVEVTADLAREQAREAERRYRAGESAPLLGVPVSVKDAFYVSGVPTTLGSRIFAGGVAKADSGVPGRLRAAGAVFTGKTNTAEFGQSATTDNMLGPDTGNPWDHFRTPGGSSGGAAASVAAGMSVLAVGSDGGGSVRIPAAFTGLVGFKPSPGICPDERGFRGMTDFVSPGPLAWRVADARLMFEVLAAGQGPALRDGLPLGPLRVGYCARPEGRPVDPGVVAAVDEAVGRLVDAGHQVTTMDPPLDGWDDLFGPLVLEDEHRERGHLLTHFADQLTRYERASLRAGRNLEPSTVLRAREELAGFRDRVNAFLDGIDVLVTPTVAVPAFPLGHRPATIDGVAVDQLWGAFPFAAPFNVAGVPAVSLPCGLSGGLPVGIQLVGQTGSDRALFDMAQQVEDLIGFTARPMRRGATRADPRGEARPVVGTS